MSDKGEQEAERRRLVKELAYEFVRLNHDPRKVYLVTDVTDDCMLELEGMPGLFSPDLFQRVNDVPEHITMEIVEPVAQPDGLEGPPEQIWIQMKGFNRQYRQGAYSAERLEDSDTPYLRATPADIAERARRVVDKMCDDSDFHFLPMRFATETDRRTLASIIAAEFAGGEKP